MNVRDFYEQRCLNLMRKRDYEKAAEGLSDFLAFSGLTPGYRSSARLLFAICLVDKMERLFPDSIELLSEDFIDNLEQYWLDVNEVTKTSTRPLGFKPFCEYFEQTIRFSLFSEFDDLSKNLLGFLNIFEQRSQGIVTQEDLVHVWIAEIDRERRGINTARTDHLSRAIIMGKTLLSLLEREQELRSIRVTLYKILADTIYYYHDPQKTLNDRANEALPYLEKVLDEHPADLYAINFRNDINQTLARRSQIDRFNHDSRSILGSLNQTSRKLLTRFPTDSPLTVDLHTIRRQIMTLRSIAMLAEGQDKILQPGSDEYEFCDISQLIIEQLHDFQFPETCLEHKGTVNEWELIPGMVSVVFDNLLKNSMEAYERAGLTIPAQPCRIAVNYDDNTVDYYDHAGGMDPAIGDIFAPYTSSKGIRSHIGLGLTNARMAMRSMEGKIELAPNQQEQGIHFILQFI